MKKIMVFLVVFLFQGISLSFAMLIPTPTVDYAISDGLYFYSGPTVGFLYPSEDGFARRFILTDSWRVTGISVFLSAPDINDPFFVFPGHARTIIYAPGSRCAGGDCTKPLPVDGPYDKGDQNKDESKGLYKTDFFSIPRYTEGWYGESSLELYLKPGDYWIGVEGGNMVRVGDFKIEGERVVPEPASYLLFGLGILFVFWNRTFSIRRAV